MRFRGREVDAIALWSEYVDFPGRVKEDEIYLPKTVCPNPDHDTLKRHFQVNTQRGTVHCFAYCGISGSFEHAICVIHGLYDKWKVEDAVTDQSRRYRKRKAYSEARKIIFKHKRAARGRGKLVNERRISRRDDGGGDRREDFNYERHIPQAGIDYLAARGIGGSDIAQWEIGFDRDELRIVIPAKDDHGITRFLIKRAIRAKDHPKYLYWPEGVAKTSLLFGACQIDLGMVRSSGLVVVEGSTDTILNHAHGLRNTGGILGTGISDQQVAYIARLRPPRIYLMFDKDTAGIRNIEIAARKLRKYPLFVCRFPTGKSDPGELSEREAQRVIERAMPFLKFKRKLHKMGITLDLTPNVNQPHRRISVG